MQEGHSGPLADCVTGHNHHQKSGVSDFHQKESRRGAGHLDRNF